MMLGLTPESVRVIYVRGVGLLRHQWRRHGDLRRGAAVAGGRPARARAALPQRRDGLGELRQLVRHRSARGSRSRRAASSRGTTRRGPPPAAGGRATTRRATSSRGSWRVTSRRRSRRARRRRRPTTPLNNGSNTAPSYIAGRVRRFRQNGAGVVRSERVLSHRVRSPFFTGPLRAPERLQNTFAHESFMDEVAAHVKADPVAYRLRHLNHARLSASRSHRGQDGQLGRAPVAAPGPRAHGHGQRTRHRVRVLRGRSTATSRMVAEVEVDQDTGRSARHSTGRRPGLSAPSRTPTACATRSKAARCRASAARSARR